MNTFKITLNFMNSELDKEETLKKTKDLLLSRHSLKKTPRPDLPDSSTFLVPSTPRDEYTDYAFSFLVDIENPDDLNKEIALFANRLGNQLISGLRNNAQNPVCIAEKEEFKGLAIDKVFQLTPTDKLYVKYHNGAVYEMLRGSIHLSQLSDPHNNVFSNDLIKLSEEESEKVVQSNFHDPNINPGSFLYNVIWDSNGDRGGHPVFSKGHVFALLNIGENDVPKSNLILFFGYRNLGDSFNPIQLQNSKYEIKGHVPHEFSSYLKQGDFDKDSSYSYKVWGSINNIIFREVEIVEAVGDYQTGYNVTARFSL